MSPGRPAPEGAPRRRDLLRLAVVLLVLAAAPTAGDIGSCGQTPEDLDPAKFFLQKKELDCARCTECGLSTFACGRVCDPAVPAETTFPSGCYPYVHDGEVCLDALEAASCDDYGAYMADGAPTVPTECNFCPEEAR